MNISKQKVFLNIFSLPFFFSKKKLYPANFTLTQFQWVQWSDAWDGKTKVSDGLTVEVLLYRGNPVYEIAKDRIGGSRESTSLSGQEEFVLMATAGKVLVEIGIILRHLRGVDKKSDHKNRINISKATLDILINHPEFLRTKEEWAEIGCIFDLKPISGLNDSYSVEVRQ